MQILTAIDRIVWIRNPELRSQQSESSNNDGGGVGVELELEIEVGLP